MEPVASPHVTRRKERQPQKPPSRARAPAAAPKAPAPSVAMAVDGQSKNTGLSKQYQAGVGDSFLRHVKEVSPQLSEQWGVNWGEVPEGAAASQEIYAHLMTYLVEIHEIAADRVPLAKRQLPGPHRYDWGSVDTLWNGLLHIQKMRFFGNTSMQKTKAPPPCPAPCCPAPPSHVQCVSACVLACVLALCAGFLARCGCQRI